MYEHLTREEEGSSHSKIWKSNIPYKIKIFLWLLEKDTTLTKDNMIKRKWVGNPTCRFCDMAETANHLFFQCPTARVILGIVAWCLGTNTIPNTVNQYWGWVENCLPHGKKYHTLGLAAIWKARNKVCFEHIQIKHPAEILYHSCSLMSYWAGLGMATGVKYPRTRG